MTLYDQHSRADLRSMYLAAWQKRLTGAVLEPVEAQIAMIIDEHPEYHPLLADRDRALGFEMGFEGGNPFLHMSLHLAIRDQVAIDRPVGIRAAYDVLTRRRGRHAAEHAIGELLHELIGQAQRSGQPPDEKVYLRRIQRMIR